MSGKIGAHIKPSEPVKKLASEGPLDQMMGIHVDDNMSDPVFLQSVLNENDLFKRCPAIGSIDFDKKCGGKSVKEILESEGYVTESLFLNPSGEGLQKYAEVSQDRFGVTDARWMDDPGELIWKTPLLAQLQAKYNAITHFLNDPSAVDFEGEMSEEDKASVAQRARELAANLKDQALNEIDATADVAKAALSESINSTKQRFSSYVVTREDAKAQGGLTEDDVAELFQGGE